MAFLDSFAFLCVSKMFESCIASYSSFTTYSLPCPDTCYAQQLYDSSFVAVAYRSNRLTTRVDSEVYKYSMEDQAFVEFQSFPTNGATDAMFANLWEDGSVLAFTNSVANISNVTQPAKEYTLIGSSIGSECDQEFSVWRPNPPHGTCVSDSVPLSFTGTGASKCHCGVA